MKNKQKRLEDLETLKTILKGTDKRLTFTNLKASQSGMSRTFEIYVNKKGQLINVTHLIASITDNTYTNQGKMRIYGCGMDMLFETCYQVNCQALYLKGKKYNHDKAYHGVVDTYYILI